MQTLFLLSTIFLAFPTAGNIQNSIINNHTGSMVVQKNTESPEIQVIKVTLLAREESTPPIGETPLANRDMGFASVFIRLKNLQQADSKITIKNLKIVNVIDGRVQNFIFSPQEFVLRPLENAEQVFHLRNKTGYLGKDTVKAIVTYQIGNLVSEINSDATPVTRH